MDLAEGESRDRWHEVAGVVTELDPQLPKLSGFRASLTQAVFGLIVNAAQAIAEAREGSADKGKIRVRTPSRDGWLEVEVEVEVEVEDDGPGIPLGIQDRIFEPFFSTRSVGQGSMLA